MGAVVFGSDECFSLFPPCALLFQKAKDGVKPASSSDVISAATVSSVHSAAPAPSTSVRNLSCRSLPQKEGLSSKERQQRDPDSLTSVDCCKVL